MERTSYVSTIIGKIKTTDNKDQYELDRQTAKVSALSSENVDKYELLTRKDILSEKPLLEKAATIKRFELGSELQKEIEFPRNNTKDYAKLMNLIKGKHIETIKKDSNKTNI